jgi:hypothetical protein
LAAQKPGFPPVWTQLPLQHSAAAPQTSLFCLQYDVATQVPPEQRPEQQSPFPAQVLPIAWHPPGAGSEPQVPSHAPPQHSLAAAHVVPLGEQGLPEQKLFVQ